jgi:hypothetical protein
MAEDPVYQRLVTQGEMQVFVPRRGYATLVLCFRDESERSDSSRHLRPASKQMRDALARASPPPDEPPHRSARRALDRLIEEPKDSSTIHYDEDTIPHGACSDPIHCDCMCPHCWLEKVEIIEAAILPAPPDDPEAHPRVHREPPSPERWKNRSRTMAGIAEAMAVQWGCCEPVAVDAADRSLEQPELSLREERIS